MKLVKEGKIIRANEKAYRLLYKARGYKPCNPLKTATKVEDKTSAGINDSKDMTKVQIAEILTSKGIDFNPRDKKDKLLELLMAGD